MALKKQAQLTLTKLAIRDLEARSNPFAEGFDAGWAHNVTPYRGKITQMPYAPTLVNSGNSNKVWKVFEFKFVRNSAAETQLIIVHSDGKIYRAQGGCEYEILPGNSSFSALSNKPCVVSIANRMHVTDGVQYLIWNGWFWVRAGMAAPAAPTTALGAGSLTGTFNICVTAAYLDNGVQIHEGPRSSTTTVSPAAQNITVNKPTLDTRANYWNVYMSEISGAGNRMRRVASVSANSASTVVSALPASTNPFAPIRNDAPQASRVLFNWKNRLGMGDRTDGKNFWFTAFEEVAANLNGAPEESVPGRNTSSISDLSNSWTLPDRGEALRAGCWHENFAFLGTDRNGYVVQGDGGLLDSRALRDFYPLKTFDHGTCGPWGMISTPYGLVNFSPEHKLILWEGGSEETDIGADIQRRLDTINGNDLYETELVYWNGNGREWLLLVSPGSPYLHIYDFDSVVQEGNGASQRGTWFHYSTFGTDSKYHISATVGHSGDLPILLIGMTDGTVRRLDAEFQPGYYNASGLTLDQAYLGSTIQDPPQAQLLTAFRAPQPERFVDARYFTVKHRLKDAPTNADASSTTNPSTYAYYNSLAPEVFSTIGQAPATTVQLSLGSRLTDGTQRAWFPASTGASAVGVRTKNLAVQLVFASALPTVNNAYSQPVAYLTEFLEFIVAWTPTDALSQ